VAQLGETDRRDADAVRKAAEQVVWFHSLDLGDGVVTKGVKSAERLAFELDALSLPDLNGRTVLDIGAWDGYFSFACERKGAARVVALDHYAWSMDIRAQQEYIVRCAREGRQPAPFERVPEVWKPRELPGKRGFDIARQRYASAVEPVVDDFMSMDLEKLGRFDVVLYLGVLYHLQDPFQAVRRLAAVTGSIAVIETDAVRFPSLDDRPLCEFFPGDEHAGDPSNWWAPNEQAVHGMCRAAGFTRVETIVGPPLGSDEAAMRYRGIFHAWR
jgi:tRNA (mo5U34)-methyltransferase